MSTNFVTMIYNVGLYYEHDSRINPGNRYKDIYRGTSVTNRLPGQKKLLKLSFDMYDENRRVGLIYLTNLCTRIPSIYIQYCIIIL